MPIQEQVARGQGNTRAGKRRAKEESRLGRLQRVDENPCWSAASPTIIGEVVQALSKVGLAVMFGRTRNKATLVFMVFDDGEKMCMYLDHYGDLDQQLLKIADQLVGTEPEVQLSLNMP